MTSGIRIEKLTRGHGLEGFDCGKPPLNGFLVQHALQSQQARASQTYLALRDDTVLGYYTLVFGHVAFDDAPERLKKGVARHPVPLMILVRLAVSVTAMGQGLGGGLLRDAMLRTLQAADIAGLRAFAVHAKDDEARRFYEHFDFIAFPVDPMQLYLLLKDAKPSLAKR